MKTKLCFLLFFPAIIATAAEHGKAFSAFALPKHSDPFRASSAKIMGSDGQLCIVGSTFVDSEARSYGRIVLVDLKRKKTLWEKTFKPAQGERDLFFNDCMQQGSHIYANANSTLYHVNQSFASIFKFDLHGMKVKSASFEIPGEQVFVRAMGMVDNQMMAVGAAKEVDPVLGQELHSVFLSKFDESLKFTHKLIKKGGFRNGSGMRILEKGVFVGGEFFPQKINLNQGDLNDYANSRISFNGNYVWSTRPQPAQLGDIASAISDSGEISSLSSSKNISYLRTVDAAGKLIWKNDFESTYCKTEQLVREGEFLYALRKPCDIRSDQLVLLEIELKTGQEREIKTLKNEPTWIFFHQSHLYAITKDGAGNLTIEHD